MEINDDTGAEQECDGRTESSKWLVGFRGDCREVLALLRSILSEKSCSPKYSEYTRRRTGYVFTFLGIHHMKKSVLPLIRTRTYHQLQHLILYIAPCYANDSPDALLSRARYYCPSRHKFSAISPLATAAPISSSLQLKCGTLHFCQLFSALKSASLLRPFWYLLLIVSPVRIRLFGADLSTIPPLRAGSKILYSSLDRRHGACLTR